MKGSAPATSFEQEAKGNSEMAYSTTVFGTSQRPFQTVKYLPPLKQVPFTFLTDHHEILWMENNP